MGLNEGLKIFIKFLGFPTMYYCCFLEAFQFFLDPLKSWLLRGTRNNIKFKHANWENTSIVYTCTLNRIVDNRRNNMRTYS